MKSSPTWVLLSLLAMGTSNAACGSLDGSPNTPSVLATVRGELSLTDTAPSMPDHVHVAIVWQTTVPGQFNVAQDVPVQPVFPSQYVLRLTEPPPDSVILRGMINGGPLLGFATGAVVAYEDLNGNGRLDLIADDAGAFIDRVIATNPDLVIAYLDSSNGQLPPMPNSHGTPNLGYNLLAKDCTRAPGDPRPADAGPCIWNTYQPVSSMPYDLPLSNDPKLNSLMCQMPATSGVAAGGGTSWNISAEGKLPPNGFPMPGAQGLTCSADGSSYTFVTCQQITMSLCDTAMMCFDERVSLGDAGVPPGWPCP